MEKKICLSIDQMQQLKELGVSTKDASMCWIKDPEGFPTLTVNDEYCYEMAFLDPVPVFTLQDMLEMMPTILPDKNGYTPYHLEILIDSKGCVLTYRRNQGDCLVGTHIHKSTLDAAFDMLCWLAKNKLLKQ